MFIFGLGFFTPIAEIPDFMPKAACLCLIAGFRPAAGAVLKIGRAVAQPAKLLAVALHDHQRVADVDRMVGAKAEFAARFSICRDQIHRPVIHHPALDMPRLWPWVGVQQIDEG